MYLHEALWRLGAIWVLGTAGIYAGLYGFAVPDQIFVVIGIVLVVLAIAVEVAGVVARWRERRAPTWVNGTAAVLAVSPRLGPGNSGGRELDLEVSAPGLPGFTVKVVDKGARVRSWPDVGDHLPVSIDIDNLSRVRVRWDEVEQAVPAAMAEGDDFALEEFPPISEDDLADIEPADPRRILPLEEEPTDGTARFLFPTERYRGEWRRHWVRPATRYVLTFGLAVAGMVLVRRYVPDDYEYLPAVRAGIPVLGWLIGSHVLFAWHLNRFVLTNKRVMLVEGVLGRRVSMTPLLRVTDLRYVQSLPGRILSYGTFSIEGVGIFSRMRRISALPNPNELYLRVVEEMYEPSAVEARLGREDLADAFREAIYGPVPGNYDGWVSVQVFDQRGEVPISEDRQVVLQPGADYRLRVVIAPQPAAGVTEPLVVSGGTDQETVEFSVEMDSDDRDLRRPARTVQVGGRRAGHAEFTIRTPAEGAPWLWVRVSQQSRLLQSVELGATVRVALG